MIINFFVLYRYVREVKNEKGFLKIIQMCVYHSKINLVILIFFALKILMKITVLIFTKIKKN
jgi:hypothetical protein